MKIEMTVEGLTDLSDYMKTVADASDVAYVRTINFTTQSAAQRMKNRIRTGVRSGRVYRREGPDRTVVASAPGEAPADDLGTLANSITFNRAKSILDEVFLSANADYAGVLEFGGYSNGSYIAPRPYFYISIDEAVAAASKKLAQEFARQL